MPKKIFFTSLLALIAALAAWALVAYGAYEILSAASARAASAKIALTKSNQVALNQRVHALAASTADDRAKLETLVGSDIVAIIDVIDAAGKSAGATAKVSDAASDGARQIIGKETLHYVTFSVQGTGRYADLIHAARLYEKLPLLSSVEQMEIERVQTSGSATWRMSARIKVLTTANISI